MRRKIILFLAAVLLLSGCTPQGCLPSAQDEQGVVFGPAQSKRLSADLRYYDDGWTVFQNALFYRGELKFEVDHHSVTKSEKTLQSAQHVIIPPYIYSFARHPSDNQTYSSFFIRVSLETGTAERLIEIEEFLRYGKEFQMFRQGARLRFAALAEDRENLLSIDTEKDAKKLIYDGKAKPAPYLHDPGAFWKPLDENTCRIFYETGSCTLDLRDFSTADPFVYADCAEHLNPRDLVGVFYRDGRHFLFAREAIEGNGGGRGFRLVQYTADGTGAAEREIILENMGKSLSPGRIQWQKSIFADGWLVFQQANGLVCVCAVTDKKLYTSKSLRQQQADLWNLYESTRQKTIVRKMSPDHLTEA